MVNKNYYEKFENALNDSLKKQNKRFKDKYCLVVDMFTKDLIFNSDKEFVDIRNKINEASEKFLTIIGCDDDIKEPLAKMWHELNSRCIGNIPEDATTALNELVKAKFDLNKYYITKKMELFKENTKDITEIEFELMLKFAEYINDRFVLIE